MSISSENSQPPSGIYFTNNSSEFQEPAENKLNQDDSSKLPSVPFHADHDLQGEPTIEEDEILSSENSDAEDQSVSTTKSSETGAVGTAFKQGERQTLARNETKAVGALRFFTLFVLLAVAAVVSAGVYFVAKDGEKATFESQFKAQGSKVIVSFHASIEQFIAALDGFSSVITNHALTVGATFPLVTVPNFEALGTTTRILSKSTLVQYMPLVMDQDREAWEAYAIEHQDQYFQSYNREQILRGKQNIRFGFEFNDSIHEFVEERNNTNRTALATNRTARSKPQIFKFIYGPAIATNETDGSSSTTGNGANSTNTTTTRRQKRPRNSGPYLPAWQTSPTGDSIRKLNRDFRAMARYQGPLDQVWQSGGQAVLGELNYQDEGQRGVRKFNIILGSGQYRHEQDKYEVDPVSTLGYPVFDSFSLDDRKVVGVLGTDLYWTMLFSNILPDHTDSDERDSLAAVYAVLETSTGQAETYFVDGADVVYLGSGDLHDQKYDDQRLEVNVADYVAATSDPTTQSYTVVPLHSNYTNYILSVYPSQEMEDSFYTNKPIWYCVGVLAIFLFVTGVFMVYNLLVEQRQSIVLDKAVKSSAVVSSLFPKKVQDRLYAEAEAKEKQEQKLAESMLKGATKRASMKDWINHAKTNDQNLNAQMMEKVTGNLDPFDVASTESTDPIADLFPEATVFFADLAGFTKWSSDRSPSEVFGFLEVIYSRFDLLALRRKVFKIETIGDCYVAVTGIPEPQSNHVVLMAKFATDCLLTFSKLVGSSLSERYGDETRELNLRIGLHCGAVTAGVLRGERARFQLFGDTVNTAARMESTGVPGRIHCTEEVAEALRESGKGNWLTARETSVVAKGKGSMNTYFIALPTKTHTTANSAILSAASTHSHSASNNPVHSALNHPTEEHSSNTLS